MDKTKAKILIVDDLPQNLVVMGEILSEVDAELVKVTSGEAALEALLTHRFALILLDVQMPILDGYQTAELIRHNPKTKTIPIIFITAINKEDVHVFEGYKVGAVDYLFKPINQSDRERKNVLVVATAEDDWPMVEADRVVFGSDGQVRFKIYYLPGGDN